MRERDYYKIDSLILLLFSFISYIDTYSCSKAKQYYNHILMPTVMIIEDG